MLAALLPGVRELRTPLAAGVLYLFALWLLFRWIALPAVPYDLIADVLMWRAIFQPALVLSALGFAAYLIGSLLTVEGYRVFPSIAKRQVDFEFLKEDDYAAHKPYFSIDDIDVRALWSWRRNNWRETKKGFRRKTKKLIRFIGKMTIGALRPFRGWEQRHEYLVTLLRLLTRGRLSPGDRLYWWTADQMSKSINAGVTIDVINEERYLNDEFRANLNMGLDHRYDREEKAEDRLRTIEIAKQHFLVQTMVQAIGDEFGVLVVRTQLRFPDIYNEYGRLRAEAKLRLSLSPPLALVVALLTFSYSPVVLLILIMVPPLLVSALRRQADADWLIWQVFFANEIESPSLQEFKGIPVAGLTPPKDPFYAAHI
ncbi:hypothetical protein [Auraticoccus monumenti]|uniref:Uncharacterized protein n=1 Tax=Auraticoccus monumenti TaxID=675864 RepID=A0A1G6RXH9_9ACTN|nr:hypothetical protein [Auraticoccus monumenti]SDD09278.1 hypothetical protein SAMN04489747_0148 [Auraticoccus monumenti]